MGSAVIFSGSKVKTLKPNLDLFGAAQILTGTVDPTVTATDAKAGSLYLNTSSGKTYSKNDNGSTVNWTILTLTSGVSAYGTGKVPTGTLAATGPISTYFNQTKFGTVNFDNTSSYNTSTGLLTVPANQGGIYLVTSTLDIQSSPNGSGIVAGACITLNGASSHPSFANVDGQLGSSRVTCTGIISVAAGDTIGIAAYCDGTSPSYSSNAFNSSFSIVKIAASSASGTVGGTITSVNGNFGPTVTLTATDVGAAPINSPALTGNPTAPTQTPLNNSTRVATTAYVDAAVTAGGGGGAVSSFNTRTGAVTLNTADVNAVYATTSIINALIFG